MKYGVALLSPVVPKFALCQSVGWAVNLKSCVSPQKIAEYGSLVSPNVRKKFLILG